MMLKPLGMLGSPFVADPGRLWPLVDALPGHLRSPVADYLGAGVLLDEDWLGYKDDPLQARASARSYHDWATDGVYFWIDSGPAYAREYGIGLPEDIIGHCLEARGDFVCAAAYVDELWDQLSNEILPALVSAGRSGLIGSEWREQPSISEVEPSHVQVLGDL